MKKIILLMAIALLIPLALAEDKAFTDQVVKYNKNSFVRFYCTDIYGLPCDTTTKCNISIYYPNTSSMINNKVAELERQGIYFYNLTTNNTASNGLYRSLATCSNTTSSGIVEFNYLVTASGEYGNLAFFVLSLVLVGVLLIFGFYKEDITITSLANIGLYIISINILISGIDIYYNQTTDIIGVVLLAIAFYLSFRVGMEYIGD